MLPASDAPKPPFGEPVRPRADQLLRNELTSALVVLLGRLWVKSTALKVSGSDRAFAPSASQSRDVEGEKKASWPVTASLKPVLTENARKRCPVNSLVLMLT